MAQTEPVETDYRSIEYYQMSFVFRAPREPLTRVDLSNIINLAENSYHLNSGEVQRARSFIKPAPPRRQNRSTILTTTCDPDTSLLSDPTDKWLQKDNSQSKLKLQKDGQSIRSKQSSMFRSQTVRQALPMIGCILSNPGPGHYEPEVNRTLKITSKKLQDESTENSVCFNLNSSYQAVPSIPDQGKKFGYTTGDKMLVLNMNPYMKYSGINEDRPGPGEYSYLMQKNLPGGNFHKSKVTRKVFQPPKDNQAQPENWTYVTEVNDKNLYESKSAPKLAQSKRSIAKDYIKQAQTASTQKRGVHQQQTDSDQQEYIETTPGPGSYDYPTSSFTYKNFRSKKPAVQKVFISKQKKFKLPKIQCKVGPGTYTPAVEVGVVMPKYSKDTGFLVGDPRFKPKDPEHSAEPASYKPRVSMENDLINRLVKGFKGRFGTNVERFGEKPPEIPGPGAYDIALTDEQKLKEQKAKLTNSYKSQVKRELFQTNAVKPGPGDYDLINIEPKQQRQFEDLNPKRAPFNSTQKRAIFPTPPPNTNPPPLCPLPSPPKQPQQSSVFKSKTNRMFSMYKGLSPAVGQYYDPQQDRKHWQTPTFNILFRQF